MGPFLATFAGWLLFVLLSLLLAWVTLAWLVGAGRQYLRPSEFFADWATLCFGGLILVETGLGLVGHLSLGAVAGVLLGAAAATGLRFRRQLAAGPACARQAGLGAAAALTSVAGRRPARLALLLLGWCAVLFLMVALAEPDTHWDTLCYQMITPVDWLRGQTLANGYIPSIEAANNYFPGNGNLLILWAILPFHNDFLVRLVPLALWALLGLAEYRLARQAGVANEAAAAGALLLMLTPIALSQAAVPQLDVAGTAFFLLTLGYVLEFGRAPAARPAILCGIAGGALLGIKYSGPLYLLLLLPIMLALSLRAHVTLRTWLTWWAMIVALVGACGGYWYLSNFERAGNPLFPVQIAIGGRVLFPGPSTQYFNQLADHLADIRLPAAAVGFVGGYGFAVASLAPLVLFWWLGARGRAAASAWPGGPGDAVVELQHHRRPAPAGGQSAAALLLLAGLCLATLLLYLKTPYSTMQYAPADPITVQRLAAGTRFSLAAGGLGIVLLMAALDRLAVFPQAVWWLVCLAMIPDALILQRAWSMGLPPPRVMAVVAVVAGLAWGLILYLAGPGRRRWRARRQQNAPAHAARRRAVGLALLVAVAVVATGGGLALVREVREGARYSVYHRVYAPLAPGWRWLNELRPGLRFAYTGTPLPYPLAGSALQHPVRYINVAGRLEDGPAEFFARPQDFRAGANYADWARNLAGWGAQYLVVQSLNGRAADQLESQWAAQHPEAFRLVFDTPGLKVFEIHSPGANDVTEES